MRGLVGTLVYVFGLMCLAFITAGCASFAANPQVCRNAPVLIPLPYVFIGNIFQIGPCASIEALRVETGAEGIQILGGVFRAVDTNKSNYWVEQFGGNMGCIFDVNALFFEKLVTNKEKIFGINGMASDREIVGRTRRMLKDDPTLSKACGINDSESV